MSFDVRHLLYRIRSSFWAIPTLLGILAVVVAIFVVDTEVQLEQESGDRSLFGGMTLDSARLTLSTIAGSMITVVSLVFSLTLVALTQVSQQLGPRILQRFMDDRPTQIVLGLFIATFVFTLIVLTRMDQQEARVPSIAVFTSVGLAVLSLGAVIHFIHHIAMRLQADVLIAELGADLHSAASMRIEGGDQWSDREARFASQEEHVAIERRFDAGRSHPVCSDHSGYLNRLDELTLAQRAQKHGLVIRIDVRPGEFVMAGMPVLTVIPETGDADDLGEDGVRAIAKVIALDRVRTPESSVAFEVTALVEVGLRALSPGVNDPFTAMTCVDRLSDGMRLLMQRPYGVRLVCDGKGDVRLVHHQASFDHFMTLAFHPLRHAATDNPQVLLHIVRSLGHLATLAREPEQEQVISSHIESVSETLGRLELAETDRHSLESAIGKVRRGAFRSTSSDVPADAIGNGARQ